MDVGDGAGDRLLQNAVGALREEGVIQQITDQYVGKGWNK
jgi:hypothetical protein